GAGQQGLEPDEGEQDVRLVERRLPGRDELVGGRDQLIPGGRFLDVVLGEDLRVVVHHPVGGVHRHAVLLAVDGEVFAKVAGDVAFVDRLLPDVGGRGDQTLGDEILEL